MINVLGLTVLGLVLNCAGFYLFYFYLTGIDAGRTPFLMIPGVLLIGGGIFLLLRAGKSNATTFALAEEKSTKTETKKTNTATKNLLDKNNEYTAEWKKVNDTKDRLKILQIDTNAETTK